MLKMFFFFDFVKFIMSETDTSAEKWSHIYYNFPHLKLNSIVNMLKNLPSFIDKW